ncbi:hypothetical protein D3C85_1516630 [compost metagenome]
MYPIGSFPESFDCREIRDIGDRVSVIADPTHGDVAPTQAYIVVASTTDKGIGKISAGDDVADVIAYHNVSGTGIAGKVGFGCSHYFDYRRHGGHLA